MDPQLEQPPTGSSMAALPDAHQVERTRQQTGESAQNHTSSELASKPSLIFTSRTDEPGCLMLPWLLHKGGYRGPVDDRATLKMYPQMVMLREIDDESAELGVPWGTLFSNKPIQLRVVLHNRLQPLKDSDSFGRQLM